jgi:NAD(P)-dependent dehydrogenase (short-subunit alcohol dehydrogenase family)
VLVNPANATNTETTSRNVQEAARALGLQIHVLNASTVGEIDAAFATLAREHTDALFVAMAFAAFQIANRLPPSKSWVHAIGGWLLGFASSYGAFAGTILVADYIYSRYII